MNDNVTPKQHPAPDEEKKDKSKEPVYYDADGNQLSGIGKVVAGALLIGFTLFCAVYLIGHWPDRLPTARDNFKPYYNYEWFHVNLIDTNLSCIRLADVGCNCAAGVGFVQKDSTSAATKADTTGKADTTSKQDTMPSKGTTLKTKPVKMDCKPLSFIHINTLLLILVAIAGFLGNLIYLATSFTTYVGSGKFRKSWLLWYAVKPFTAAALAIGMYFVFRGGFLNMSDESANINIYGLITISLLTGLFTDRATLKLKEVFDVLLKPKEDRPGSLEGKEPEIDTISPQTVTPGNEVVFTLTGKNFSAQNLAIKFEDRPVKNLVVKPDTITFSYSVPASIKDKQSITVSVSFPESVKSKNFDIRVASAADQAGQAPAPTEKPVNDPVNPPAVDTITDINDILPDNSSDLDDNAQPVVQG